MNQFFYRLIFIVTVAMAAMLVGCDNNDDDGPAPATPPTAGFSFTVDELTVNFTNSSTNAATYSWDFGDGNTSTDANPAHTYAAEGTYNVALTATNGSLTDTETQSVAVALKPENIRLKSGFIVVGQTDEQTWFAQYFAELPSGTVDISQGTAFQQFFPLSVIDGSVFLARTDGSPGFEKLAVNGNEEFVEDGIISTISGESFVIAARDSEFGLFHDRADPNTVNTFNPTTMEVTGTIDMTVANDLVDDPVRYQDFIFRGDNEVFVPTRLEAGGNVPNVALPRIDISAGAVVDVAQFEGLGNVVVLNSSRRFFDENGNFYFWHAGNIGFPTISGSILSIPAGTNDYDSTYNFKVPEINNPAVIGAGSFMSAFNYYQNNIGFALINEELDQRIFDLVVQRGGVENLSDMDFQMIQLWLFTSPTGAIVEVDVVNQTVRKINGLPALSVFDVSGINFLGGKPFFSVSNPQVNALYEYDEMMGSVTKVFDMVGARISTIVDLSSTVQ